MYKSSIGFSCELEPVLVRLDKWQKKDVLNMYHVKDFRITPMKLADMNDALIMRKFGPVEQDN